MSNSVDTSLVSLFLFMILLPGVRGWISKSFVVGAHSCRLACDLAAFTPNEHDISDYSHSIPYQNPSNALSKQRQLWLDLRETAIRPDEALSFLQDLIFDSDDDDQELDDDDDDSTTATTSSRQQSISINDLVDRILLTEHAFEDLVQTQKSQGILYVTNGGALVADTGSSQQSIQIGKVIFRSINGMFDPTIALDDDFEWILLDIQEDVGNIQLYTEQVEGLLQIVQASSFDTNKSQEQKVIARQRTGGKCVAVACPTRELLISIDRCLAVQNISGGRFTAQTDSGILIASNNGNNTLEERNDGDDWPTTAQSSLFSKPGAMTTAVVLPFDSWLWKTALELQQEFN
ncbi:hypothetical protein ACA910_021710 [Epithemia clementina (nom. ined.)]